MFSSFGIAKLKKAVKHKFACCAVNNLKKVRKQPNFGNVLYFLISAE